MMSVLLVGLESAWSIARESNEKRSRLKSVGISRRVNGDLELSSVPKLPVFHVSRYFCGQDDGKSIRRRFLPLSAMEQTQGL